MGSVPGRSVAILPPEYHPLPPEPPSDHIIAAARHIASHMAYRGGLVGGERQAGLAAACKGFPAVGVEKPAGIDRSVFRWAVRWLLEAGLVEVVRVEPGPSVADDFFEWREEREPDYGLRSTPALWVWWTEGAPDLEATATKAKGRVSTKGRVSRKEAEDRVRDYLAKSAKADPAKVTIRDVAMHTGLSVGRVQRTPPWRTFNAERAERSGRNGNRTVSLTAGLQATIPANVKDPCDLAGDRELAELIEQQAKDIRADGRTRRRRT